MYPLTYAAKSMLQHRIFRPARLYRITLTGYGGGLWRKAWLLNHERNISIGQQMSLF